MSLIFEKYPYIKNLRALVPDELIESELGSKAEEFDVNIERAKELIQTVNLNKIFPDELERGKIVLENFLGHWGNVSVEELCKICLIVKFLQPKRMLEIGTYNGMTTLQMALNAPKDCVTYTLDLPDEQIAAIELSKLDSLVSKFFKNKFGTKTGSYFLGRKDVSIIQKLGDSSTFDYDELGKEKMDLIFIDAGHDYRNKKIDSENAFRLVNKNGVIIWHNYNDVTSPDVTKYLADISGDYKLHHLRNTMLVVYKNS
jgi:predicted O-methyltransferase YrrM